MTIAPQDRAIIERDALTETDGEGHYVRTIPTWFAVTNEALADAQAMRPYLDATFEYSFSGAGDLPLTWRERVTGTRLFTASNGYVLHVPVGWRAELRDALRDLARLAWPEDYPPEEDD